MRLFYGNKLAPSPRGGLFFNPVVMLFLVFLWLGLCSSCISANPRTQYLEAQKCSIKLKKSPKLQKYRDRWMVCIQGYLNVYKSDPGGPWAAAGLYEAAMLYEDMYKRSRRQSDRTEAIDLLERIVKRFPRSAYNAKARDALAQMSKIVSLKSRTIKRPLPKIVALPQKKPPKPKAPPKPAMVKKEEPVSDILNSLASDPKAAGSSSASTPSPKPAKPATVNNTGKAMVTGLRFWSSKSYTRVVIDADHDTTFEHHLLKKDPSIGKPQRLFVDMDKSRVSKTLKKAVTIQDDLLSGVRAAQYDHNTVRVVVDLKSFKSYKVFSLKNPFRIVIDVRGEKKVSNKIAAPTKRPTLKMPDTGGKIPKGSLAKQFALGVSTIVIDPGHGGKDYGAPGAIKGVHEKHVVLAIAKKLKKELEKQTPCKVYLTRSTDKYLTLEERTAIANTKNADLFISIHTNAHPVKSAYGIETYYLNLATDDESIRVAAMENQTSKKNISDLQSILDSLMHNNKVNESQSLAYTVQNKMCDELKVKYSRIRNKGVKKAPFYVLLGAEMPAVLVETAFISNKRECKRLTNDHYQGLMVDGIVKGVKEYVNQLNPTMSGWSTDKNKPSG